MQIWTTPQLNEQILEKGLPVTVKAEQEIKEIFLRDAAVCDMAVIPIDDKCRDFLCKAKAKGIHGPILFISPEAVIEGGGLYGHQAFILDQKKMGNDGLKRTVSFILALSLSRIPAGLHQSFTTEEFACLTNEGPKEADVNIRETLSTLQREEARVVVAFQMLEDDEPVTVRGTCILKTLAENTIVLSRFKPIPLLQGAKPGMEVAMLFTLGEERYHATITSRSIGDDELIVSIPDRLYFVRRRFFRIEPSPPLPVHLTVLLPHQPTVLYKALEIGQRGVSFVGTGALDLGRVYAFTVMLPEPSTVIGSYGIIRSKKETDNGFRYGAELHIHPRDEEDIARYIMRRELQILSLLG